MAKSVLPNSGELVGSHAKTFTRRIVLTTAIIAVLLAITSLGHDNTAMKTQLTQQRLSDQWAAYQSTNMREHLYKTNGLRLEADLLERGSAMSPNIRTLYGSMQKDMKMEEVKYREEKKKLEEETRRLEAELNKNLATVRYFSIAEFLLQIAIVVGLVSILAASRQR